MSNEIELWIGTRQLSARVLHRRLLREPMAASAITVPFTGNLSDMALAITNLLAQLGAASTLRVCVSDAYCRYLLLPRPAGARNKQELDAAISARFQSSFGENADDWILTTDSPPMAKFDLACALRRRLYEAIQAGAQRLPLVSLQPLWIWCAQQTARKCKADHWLIVAEGQGVTSGLFRSGQCVGVRSSRQFTADDTLANIVLRESALYAQSDGVRHVCVYGKALLQSAKTLSDDFVVTVASLPAHWDAAGGQA